jgi:hypothetical protein
LITATRPEPVTEPETEADDSQGMSHYFCCLEDRGICGTRLDGDFDDDDDEPAECLVCRAMEDQPCEVTCHPWMGQVS